MARRFQRDARITKDCLRCGLMFMEGLSICPACGFWHDGSFVQSAAKVDGESIESGAGAPHSKAAVPQEKKGD